MTQAPVQTMKASRVVLVLASIVLNACGGGGGTTTPDTGVFKARVTTSATPVYGLVLSVTGASAIPVVIPRSGVTGKVSSASGGGWRVLLIGPVGTEPFLEIPTSAGASAPGLTVLDASGGQADSYKSLAPATVKVAASRN